MKQHKNVLIQNSFQKAEEALKTAEINLENNLLDGAQNRIYYSIFYAVMALGYYNKFITSKHSQLLGWFNKKFIKDDKVFEPELFQIYQNAYKNRMESDYEFTARPNREKLVKSLNKAVYFVEIIKNYIKE
ncbi:MAG TPA: hypothetical protein DDW90_03280 [Cyanobacteria bacterium UBA9971]|nr:hypothetical protein [Cyanobacteria bacterium UBA9971]